MLPILRKQITVIASFKGSQYLLMRYIECMGECLCFWNKIGSKLLLSNTTDASIHRIHTDIIEAVESTKDGQLPKARDTRKEHKTEVAIAILDIGVKPVEHRTVSLV